MRESDEGYTQYGLFSFSSLRGLVFFIFYVLYVVLSKVPGANQVNK